VMVCGQCNGKGVTIGVESLNDVSGNTEGFMGPGRGTPIPTISCSQCLGKGWQNS
jgi:hypothetical protein